jgi:GT2 family glycosyltransferase
VLQWDVRGSLGRTDYVHLSRPMLGMQINPLSTPGRFQLKELDVVPVASHRVPLANRGTRFQSCRESADTIGIVSHKCSDITSAQAESEYPELRLLDEPSVDWSIVIPTINDARRVVKCIRTCRQHLEPGLTAEFLVVDDGTRDQATLQELAQASADLDFRLLLNHQNLGFSATVNHGMRHARGRYIALCNNDIVFFQPCLGALVRAFEAVPEAGVVGAKLLYPTGTLQHVGMDKVPGQLRWIHSFQDFPAHHPAAVTSRYVWSVTGALVAFRRQTLQRLGGVSNAYATAYEDVDYCLHAWSNGERVWFCPEAVAVHEESGTRGRTRGRKNKLPLFWSERELAGRQYFEKKWEALREIESFEQVMAGSLAATRSIRSGARAVRNVRHQDNNAMAPSP